MRVIHGAGVATIGVNGRVGFNASTRLGREGVDALQPAPRQFPRSSYTSISFSASSVDPPSSSPRTICLHLDRRGSITIWMGGEGPDAFTCATHTVVQSVMGTCMIPKHELNRIVASKSLRP